MQPRATTPLSAIPPATDALSQTGHEARQRIISGTRWSAVSQIGTQLLRFVLSLVLARLLSPSEFGLIAMAWLIIGFVELFKDLGTISAVVQVEKCSRELLNAVFVLNLIIGCAGYALICVCAPLVADMYRQPGLTRILSVLALTLPISSLGLAMRALLQRELRFGKLAYIDLATAIANGVVAVILALRGWGVWALVFASVASTLATTALLWLSCTWRPSFAFRLADLKGISHFSLNMAGSQIFGYLITQADKFLIGRFLGELALGVYSMAQRLMETVLSFITAPVAKVLFPAFSRMQNDNEQIGLLYTRVCGAIALVAFPMLVGLALLAEPFVVVVLGEKWRPLIPLMVILAVPTLVQSLAMTVSSIYMVKAKPHWLLGWQVGAGILTAASYVAGLKWGVVGMAKAYAAIICVLAFPAFAIPFRFIQLSIWKFLRSFAPYAAGTLVMAGAVLGVKYLLQTLHAPLYLILILSTLTGVLTFLGIMWLLKVEALGDVAELFLLRRPPRPAAQDPARPLGTPPG